MVQLSPKERQKKNARSLAAARRRGVKPVTVATSKRRRQQKQDYYRRNRDTILKKNADRVRGYLKTRPEFRAGLNLRRRLHAAMANNYKTGSTIEALGCSIEELRDKFEDQFEAGMTWDNYGEWHIDHCRPLANFDLTDPEQVAEACHFSNLQPLWAEDNLRKGASYVEA
jgi:AraC-like DNA-binding protein